MAINSIKVGNVVHPIEDQTAREHLVEVGQTQPVSEANRLWIKNQENEYEVPTMTEFMETTNSVRQVENEKADMIFDSESGAIASFSDGAYDLKLSDCVVQIVPIQDLSGGNPSPSNICPIGGWTSCSIKRTNGKETTDPGYIGNTYIIDWDDEAGTVYGGTLNANTGVLTVTDANIESYAGETLPSTWISDRDVYEEGTTPTVGAQVIYKLAEAVTYQLDPVVIKTLLGRNDIFASTGDISVQYRADTKLYISKKLIELQALTTNN